MSKAVTKLLTRVTEGDRSAVNLLFTPIYDQLRALAQSLMNAERSDHTLSATALVNEAYIKLVGQESIAGQDRVQFLAIAGHAMRQILIDHARGKGRIKRGGDRDRLTLDSSLLGAEESSSSVDAEEIGHALARLGEIRPRAQQVVDMRFFSGMTFEQISGVLDVSVSTAEREWRYARAWLKQALSLGGEIDDGRPSGESDDRTTGG